MRKRIADWRSGARRGLTALMLTLAAGSAIQGTIRESALLQLFVAPRAQVSASEALSNEGLRARAARRAEPLQSTITPTPIPSPTALPDPTAAVREFEGLYGSGFEASLFTEGTQRCLDDAWWLHGNTEFYDAFEALRAERRLLPSPFGFTTTPYIVRTRFRGELLPPGNHGHLGAYERAVRVLELIEMTDTDLCGMAAADVGLLSKEWHWANEQRSGCVPDRPDVLEADVCLTNGGRQEATDFWAEIHVEDGPVHRFRVCNLLPGEVRCLPSVPMTRGYIDLDSSIEIRDERFRENNWVSLIAPTLTPPPRCTAVPAGRATPMPPPSPTPWTCGTAEPPSWESRLFVPLNLR